MGLVRKFAHCMPIPLEVAKGIELMRAGEHRTSISTVQLDGDGFSIDTMPDYDRATNEIFTTKHLAV